MTTKTKLVNEEKYKTSIKTNDDIEEIFKPFLIQHNTFISIWVVKSYYPLL